MAGYACPPQFEEATDHWPAHFVRLEAFFEGSGITEEKKKRSLLVAGLSTHIVAVLSRLRYCEYLGKLFCHCCHSNSRAVIPGRVLQRWDFSPQPVSNFARDLLDRMAADPLFNIRDLNPDLYRRVKVLNRLRQCRTALHYLHQYILCCRLATRLQDSLGSVQQHLLDEPHVYSLEDLEQARQGVLVAQLLGIQDDCERHCLACPICTGRGFICEICNNADQLVFPFQLSLAAQCTGTLAAAFFVCYYSSAQVLHL
ncbi:hypothetical protein HPB52_008793 [Rhipicephalus sanguineus]|uniref:Rubicon Homology domain-containing protein n=1 Tax=Rhipicephalus sanguineus TaxID=34632 RepID=A0A9D4T080_RHISA|nr:hypothetical protein HPB52_008793 [Rhipicephalus sanguineus]